MEMSEMDEQMKFLTSDEAMYLIRISLKNTIVDFSKKGFHPESREVQGMRTLLHLFNGMQMASDWKDEYKKDKRTWNKLLSDMDILHK